MLVFPFLVIAFWIQSLLELSYSLWRKVITPGWDMKSTMHKEKQAAGAAAAAADVGTVTVSDGGGDGGNASSTDLSRKRSVGIKHVV